MKKTSIAVLLTAIISGGGFFYYQSSVAAEQKAPPKQQMTRTIAITTEQVASHEIHQSLTLIGKLEAQRSVEIASEVAAKVENIVVDTKSSVKKGDLLVQLDDAQAKASYDEAKAYLADEKRKYSEYKKLVKRGAVTQTELDAQQASVDIAAARLEAAKASLEDHALTAPFSGTVGLIDISPGHMLTTGSTLFSLDDLSTMRLDIQVPEQYLSYLYEGMKVSATSQAWSDLSFEGEIQAIDSRVQSDSLNIKVRVNFDNSNGKLKPGMLMSAEMAFAPIETAVIPVQAIEYSGTKRFVYVVDQKNTAKRTEVTLGTRVDNQVVIESGIEIGDRVVVQGLVNLRDGAKVNDLTAKKSQGTLIQGASAQGAAMTPPADQRGKS